jgi:O-antigen/teichoic acid export membrane protein
MQWRAVLVTGGVSSFAMGVLAALAMPIIPAVFGLAYRPSVELIWIMAPSGVFLALNQVVGDLLRGRGRPLRVAIAQGGGAGLTIAMLIVLIPILGAKGAAITTTVTYAITTLIMLDGLRRTGSMRGQVGVQAPMETEDEVSEAPHLGSQSKKPPT